MKKGTNIQDIPRTVFWEVLIYKNAAIIRKIGNNKDVRNNENMAVTETNSKSNNIRNN